MIKNLLMGALSLGALNSFSQAIPNIDWVEYYSERAQISNVPSAIDANNNAYITGYTFPSSPANQDATTIKYGPSGGTPLWVKNYDNGGADNAKAIVVDANYVYVAGESDGTGTGKDVFIIKYDAATGNQIFVYRWNGSANLNDAANAIVLNPANGDIYVTGYTTNPSGTKDYVYIKLNNAGAQQFAVTFNGAANQNDEATALAFGNNTLYVTGNSTNASGNTDILTLGLNPTTGATVWTKIENGTGNSNDNANAITTDGTSVIVVGGINNTSTGDDYITVKYNGATGSTLFNQQYDFGTGSNFATSIIVDLTGGYAVTGIAYNASIMEYHSIKYSGSGAVQWVNKVSTSLTGYNSYPQIVTDPLVHHFYVCGQKNGIQSDIYVYQITPGGNTSWQQVFNGAQNNLDCAVDLVVNAQGVLYVAGASLNSNAKFDYTTIRVSQTPVAFPPDINNEPPAKTFLFNQNLGQIANTAGQLVPDIKYYTNSGQELYFTNNSLSYVFAKTDTSASTPDTTVRIDLQLVKANTLTQPYAFEEQPGVSNYYLAHCPNGVTNVKGNQRLMIPNIYPNIDLHFYSNQHGLKYYFVVKPGGNPNLLLLFYDGAASSMTTTAGELYVTNAFAQIYQDKPTAYQVNMANQVVPITAWQPDYIAAGTNTYKFNIGTYNTGLPLIIEVDQGNSPLSVAAANPEWSTFFGGSGDDAANEIDTDGSGNLYGTGTTRSTNFPLQNGQQTTLSGGQDAFAVKFDNNYSRQWSTYFGGSNTEEGTGIGFDNSANKIYLSGTTASTNIPLLALSTNTANSYVESSNSPTKGYILRLAALTGASEWLTKFGFADAANPTKIKADANGNIFVIGNIGFTGVQNSCATPTNNAYPICNPGSGAYVQNIQASATFGGTTTNTFFLDGYIAKFDAQTQLKWSTLFGGNGDDIMNDLAIDNVNQKLYVVGSTKSTNLTGPLCAAATDGRFPLCNPTGSYFQQAINGNNSGSKPDGFISRFTLNGNLDWSTYFGGNGDEAITDIAIDNTGKPVITGYSSSTSYGPNCQPSGIGFPLCTGGFTQAPGGGYDAFISKFSTTAGLQWSTLYGGTGWDGTDGGGSPKIATNTLNNEVYISGSTQSCASWPLKPKSNFYQQNTHQDAALCSTSGANEGFVAGFDASNSQIYSSYFGGKGAKSGVLPPPTDLVSSIATYQNKVYICGHSYSTSQYPFACPATTNPYCDNTYVSVNSTNGTALFAQLVTTIVGIEEQVKHKTDQFKVYPNPSNSVINFEWTNSNSRRADIMVYNSIGQLVHRVAVNENTGLNTQSINISALPAGVYISIIKSEGQILNAKFIKE